MALTILIVRLFALLPLIPVSVQGIPGMIGADLQEQAAFPENALKSMRIVHVTAYSSTPEETDDTPFVTASGTAVRDGVIAANFLPFGTKVQIPRLFGQKLFVVEDRMHRRKENFVDIWMPAKSDALRFGIHEAELIILADGEGK